MSRRVKFFLVSLAGLLLLGILLYQIPAIRARLEWRYEVWATRFKNTIDPVVMPTPVPSTPFATFTPQQLRTRHTGNDVTVVWLGGGSI
jgi:hypothetical protein